jgi:hypothetical protein
MNMRWWRCAQVVVFAVCLGACQMQPAGRTVEQVVSGTVEADDARLASRYGGRVAKICVE